MRTLRPVAVAGIVVALLAACEEAPVSAPVEQKHEIEGSWSFVELRAIAHGYSGGQEQTQDVSEQLRVLGVSVHDRKITLEDGTYRQQTKLTAGSQWEHTTARYFIDEQNQHLILLVDPNGDRANVFRYKMEGTNLVISNRIEVSSAPPGSESIPFTVSTLWFHWKYEPESN